MKLNFWKSFFSWASLAPLIVFALKRVKCHRNIKHIKKQFEISTLHKLKSLKRNNGGNFMSKQFN
jgi:hypothetical protein